MRKVELFFKRLKGLFLGFDSIEKTEEPDGSVLIDSDGFALKFRVDDQHFEIIQVKPKPGKRCGVTLLRLIADFCEDRHLEPVLGNQEVDDFVSKLMPEFASAAHKHALPTVSVH